MNYTVQSYLDLIHVREHLASLNINTIYGRSPTPLDRNGLKGFVCKGSGSTAPSPLSNVAQFDQNLDSCKTLQSTSLSSNREPLSPNKPQTQLERPDFNNISFPSSYFPKRSEFGTSVTNSTSHLGQDGVSSQETPVTLCNVPNPNQLSITDVLGYHGKCMVRCYPELSVLNTIMTVPGQIPLLDTDLYRNYLFDKLNSHTYPLPPGRRHGNSYFEDSRQESDESSSDEEDKTKEVDEEQKLRFETKELGILSKDILTNNSWVANSYESEPTELPDSSSSKCSLCSDECCQESTLSSEECCLDSNESSTGGRIDRFKRSFPSCGASSEEDGPATKRIKLNVQVDGRCRI